MKWQLSIWFTAVQEAENGDDFIFKPGISPNKKVYHTLQEQSLPCLIVNVMRGGPGLGTIQPEPGRLFQTVKGGGHGDYRLIALAPASVQEMADFVALGFDLALNTATR